MLSASLLFLSLLAAPALAKTQQVKVAGTMATLNTDAASSAAVTCPKGQLLTYSIKTVNLDSSITLAKAQAYFKAFRTTAPSSKRLGNSGNNGVGSTRSYNVTDAALKSTATIKETLTDLILPASNGANLELRFSSNNERYYSGSLVFYSDYSDLTVGQTSGGPTHLQLYKNVCANNQDLAGKALAQKLQDDLAFWINALSAPVSSTVSSKPVSSTVSSKPVSSTASSKPVSSSARPSSSVKPSSTVSLPPPNPTGTAITCKQGQSLTYAISSQMDPGNTLASAQAYFRNWIGDAPSATRGGSTGNNDVGSTRSYTITDSSLQSVAPINEVLTSVQLPSSSSSNLRQQWQITSTQGFYGGKLQLYQVFSDLTVGQKNDGSAVFFQLFANVCANDQTLANKALPQLLLDSLNFWNAAA